MISDSQSSERRRDQRLVANVPVKIYREGGDIVTETGNISRSGVYCRVNEYIEPMTKMEVCLLIPKEKAGKNTSRNICCSGIVVRSEPVLESSQYNVAIFFSEIAQRDVKAIDDFIKSRLEK